MTQSGETYLPMGLAAPVPGRDGLELPFWEAAANGDLVAQRCNACEGWQWGPEWMCHHCYSFELSWVAPPGPARLFSWERSYYPVHPALREHGPYLSVVVEFPEADDIRMVGNLLGDPAQEVLIGTEVVPVFEHRPAADGAPEHTLVQWAIPRS